jgi:hypothetical protein
LPFISLPTGEKISDSTRCFQYLKDVKNVTDIDEALTPQERASSVAYKFWLEEWLYFLMLWDRFIDNWYETREGLVAETFLPFYPIRVVLFKILYRRYASILRNKGILSKSKEDLVAIIAEAVKTLSVLVGDTGMFEGKPWSLSAFLFGILVAMYEWPKLNKAWTAELVKYPNLRSWTECMMARYYPDREFKS